MSVEYAGRLLNGAVSKTFEGQALPHHLVGSIYFQKKSYHVARKLQCLFQEALGKKHLPFLGGLSEAWFRTKHAFMGKKELTQPCFLKPTLKFFCHMAMFLPEFNGRWESDHSNFVQIFGHA